MWYFSQHRSTVWNGVALVWSGVWNERECGKNYCRRIKAISTDIWALRQPATKKKKLQFLGDRISIEDTDAHAKEKAHLAFRRAAAWLRFCHFVFLCSYKPILDYIDAQFEKYLEEELKIKRSLFSCHDTRIHICLYFIAPNGHSLKSLDLVTMKKLDSKVSSSSLCTTAAKILFPSLRDTMKSFLVCVFFVFF